VCCAVVVDKLSVWVVDLVVVGLVLELGLSCKVLSFSCFHASGDKQKGGIHLKKLIVSEDI